MNNKTAFYQSKRTWELLLYYLDHKAGVLPLGEEWFEVLKENLKSRQLDESVRDLLADLDVKSPEEIKADYPDYSQRIMSYGSLGLELDPNSKNSNNNNSTNEVEIRSTLKKAGRNLEKAGYSFLFGILTSLFGGYVTYQVTSSNIKSSIQDLRFNENGTPVNDNHYWVVILVWVGLLIYCYGSFISYLIRAGQELQSSRL